MVSRFSMTVMDKHGPSPHRYILKDRLAPPPMIHPMNASLSPKPGVYPSPLMTIVPVIDIRTSAMSSSLRASHWRTDGLAGHPRPH